VRHAALFALLLLSGFVAPISAQPLSTDALRALSALDGVDVTVSLFPSAAAFGLDSQSVMRHIVQRLDAAGIRYFGREQPVRQGIALLEVQITGRSEPHNALLYMVATSVVEPVLLVRDPGRSVVAAVWRAPPALVLAGRNTASSVLEQVERQVNTFTRDYRAANPTR